VELRDALLSRRSALTGGFGGAITEQRVEPLWSGAAAPATKARATLAARQQFVAIKEAAGETELRAVMRWPGDEERLADLNVFLVPTPQRAS
jgi:hypothetical protein